MVPRTQTLPALGEDQSILDVMLDLVSYFTALAAERRLHPTDDLSSVIANAEIDGRLLPDMDMLGHYVIIATAGHDTTSNAIAGGLVALMEYRDQLELLRAATGVDRRGGRRVHPFRFTGKALHAYLSGVIHCAGCEVFSQATRCTSPMHRPTGMKRSLLIRCASMFAGRMRRVTSPLGSVSIFA